jgi:hypothetical protein
MVRSYMVVGLLKAQTGPPALDEFPSMLQNPKGSTRKRRQTWIQEGTY